MRPIENRVIVLVTHDDKIFYCNHHSISVSDLEGKLPYKFTMCRVKSFDSTSGLITVKVEGSGQLDREDYLTNSEANAELFKVVQIKKIRLYGQHRPLYQEPVNRVKTHPMVDFKPPNVIYTPPFFTREIIPEQATKEESEKVIQFRRHVPVTDLTFGDGVISFVAYIQEVSSHVVFEIAIVFIKPEFNSIKKYFAKQFKHGNADVLCEVKYKGAVILDSQVISHNLNTINEETISIIVDDLIQDYIIDFESEDISPLEDSLKDIYEVPNNNIEQWLMSKLSQESLTKHHEHLMYLSGLHERNLFPLKITGKPISFLFGFRKENRINIVWETHNTKEATYIWRISERANDNIHEFISVTENLVKNLRQGNKRSYRSANKNNSDFKVVEHDYSLPNNGFEKWRSIIEKVLNSG